MNCYDVIIIGGGLAGLTSAIHLSQKNHSVLVIEKKHYPHHKVCGEYVSNEIVPYLNHLGVDLDAVHPKRIQQFLISSAAGKSVRTQLPLGGLGISRFAFDNILFEKAVREGAQFVHDSAIAVTFHEDTFEVVLEKGQAHTAQLVIGAYGKRSGLDKQLKRSFIRKKSPWLGVKGHYRYDKFPDDLVALHNFNGGYGGLSKTETGAVNFCYLTSYQSFQKEKSIAQFNKKVVAQNPFLSTFLEEAVPLFKEPLSIAQITFHKKMAVENHILMCGDTAGLIHPLCGNGMAMAIHAAKIASELIHDYLDSKTMTRSKMEERYKSLWNKTFKKRVWNGRQLQALLLDRRRSDLAMNLAVRSPGMLRALIKTTHGKEL